MDKKYNDITLFYKVTQYAYEKQYKKLMAFLEDNYFQTETFQSNYSQYTDDFIFRMDITSLSYGEVLKLSYRSLIEEDEKQYLLGMKMIVVKLQGNQRYTYYDCDQIRRLRQEIAVSHGYELSVEKEQSMTENLLEICRNYMPIGLEGMNLEEYRAGSTRSIYDGYQAVDEKILEKEYKRAVRQGMIYPYMIEIDHYINGENNKVTKYQWVHLANLLAAHYATEKASWSKELSKDLLRTYSGLKDCCSQEEFKSILFQITAGTIKTALNKIMTINEQVPSAEVAALINYIVNVFHMDNNSMYLDYIRDLEKVLEKEMRQKQKEEERRA